MNAHNNPSPASPIITILITNDVNNSSQVIIGSSGDENSNDQATIIEIDPIIITLPAQEEEENGPVAVSTIISRSIPHNNALTKNIDGDINNSSNLNNNNNEEYHNTNEDDYDDDDDSDEYGNDHNDHNDEPIIPPVHQLGRRSNPLARSKRPYVRKLKKKERTGSNNLRLYHERRRFQIAMERAHEANEREIEGLKQTDPTNPRVIEYERLKLQAEEQRLLSSVLQHQHCITPSQELYQHHERQLQHQITNSIINQVMNQAFMDASSFEASLQQQQQHQQPLNVNSLVQLDHGQLSLPYLPFGYPPGPLTHVIIPAPTGTYPPYIFSESQLRYLNDNATEIGCLLHALVQTPGFSFHTILPSSDQNSALLNHMIQQEMNKNKDSTPTSSTSFQNTNPTTTYFGTAQFVINRDNIASYAIWLIPLFFSLQSPLPRNCLAIQTQFQFPHRCPTAPTIVNTSNTTHKINTTTNQSNNGANNNHNNNDNDNNSNESHPNNNIVTPRCIEQNQPDHSTNIINNKKNNTTSAQGIIQSNISTSLLQNTFPQTTQTPPNSSTPSTTILIRPSLQATNSVTFLPNAQQQVRMPQQSLNTSSLIQPPLHQQQQQQQQQHQQQFHTSSLIHMQQPYQPLSITQQPQQPYTHQFTTATLSQPQPFFIPSPAQLTKPQMLSSHITTTAPNGDHLKHNNNNNNNDNDRNNNTNLTHPLHSQPLIPIAPQQLQFIHNQQQAAQQQQCAMISPNGVVQFINLSQILPPQSFTNQLMPLHQPLFIKYPHNTHNNNNNFKNNSNNKLPQ